MNATDRIYAVVASIPKGRVATYGQIARLAGNPRMARAVGNALHKNPFPDRIPRHRVVNHEGGMSPAFAFGGGDRQANLLKAEGVSFVRPGVVDLERCLWNE